MLRSGNVPAIGRCRNDSQDAASPVARNAPFRLRHLPPQAGEGKDRNPVAAQNALCAFGTFPREREKARPDIKSLTRDGLLALGPCTRHLSRGAAGSPAAASERWQLQLARPEALLALTAGAVSSLIAHEDPALVRHCAGRNCTLWFVDRTKAHRRIYCSAAVCGNRAKVAAAVNNAGRFGPVGPSTEQ